MKGMEGTGMNELKLCPFCGGEGKVIKLNQKGFKGEFKVFIRCTKCGLKTNTQYPLPHDSYLTRLERAINSWNSNINPIADHLQQENKQLRELLEVSVADLVSFQKIMQELTRTAPIGGEHKCVACNEKDCQYCGFGDYWCWKHADKLKGLIENN